MLDFSHWFFVYESVTVVPSSPPKHCSWHCTFSWSLCWGQLGSWPSQMTSGWCFLQLWGWKVSLKWVLLMFFCVCSCYDAVVCAVVLRDGYWSWESYSHCVMWTPACWLVPTKWQSCYLLSYRSIHDFYLCIGWTISGTMQKNVKSNSLEFSVEQQQQEGVALLCCCIARKKSSAFHLMQCNFGT